MGIYPMNSSDIRTSNNDDNDFVWNNPNELDLLEIKRLPPVTQNRLVRNLYSAFDSLCPSIYRIHSCDSFRVLTELICLINEYLHVFPSLTMSPNELFSNLKYLDEYISQVKQSILIPKKSSSFNKTELRCFGQGIQSYHSNNKLHQTSLFCFELTTTTQITSSSLPLDVFIVDPDENLVPFDIKYINTYNQGYTQLFSCSYTPISKAGIYSISFLYNHRKITDQQYMVFICNTSSNSSSYQMKEPFVSETMMKKHQSEVPQYELEGDGCSTKIIVNSIARFRLRMKSAMIPNLTVDSFSLSILDPYGHKIVVQRRVLSPDLLELTYQPMSIGQHQLMILFNNKIHRQLTIDVIQDELNFLSNLKPFGPGLKRAIVGLPTEFYVDLNQTNNPNIHFRLEPSYHAEIDYEQQLATVRYTPLKEGDCPIHILENDKDISHSPFITRIEKSFISREKPRVRVVGLSKQIMLHRPVEFQVFIDNPLEDSNNVLSIDILTDDNHAPSVSIRRRHRSSYFCSFIPVTLGKHLISIDYAGIVAEHNPFVSHAIQEKDILLTGPAIHNQCLTLNKPTHFSFALKDCLTNTFNDKSSTYESGYSSNDDISSKSSSITDIQTSTNEEDNNYRITITDGHGNIKPNVLVKELYDTKQENNIRVDFTPDEQILYINISCTW